MKDKQMPNKNTRMMVMSEPGNPVTVFMSLLFETQPLSAGERLCSS